MKTLNEIRSLDEQWSSSVKDMSSWIGPTAKQVWNIAQYVLQNFFGVCDKHNSLSLGSIQPSSPSTIELQR